MNKEINKIYEFGKEVAIKAREHAIQNIFDLLSQKRADYMGKLLAEQISRSNFSVEQIENIKMLAIDCIDVALYGIFLNFEQSMGKYKIITSTEDGESIDIVTQSDGLTYGYLEFIDGYSKYNTADDFLETGKLEKEPIDK